MLFFISVTSLAGVGFIIFHFDIPNAISRKEFAYARFFTVASIPQQQFVPNMCITLIVTQMLGLQSWALR